MSYHNLPIYIPEYNITETHVRQHAVLVDLMIYREFKREGWCPHAIPFYPGLMNDAEKKAEMNSDNATQKNVEDGIPKAPSINESGSFTKPAIEQCTTQHTMNMPRWIDKGRIFRKKNSRDKTMIKEVEECNDNQYSILTNNDISECKNENTIVKELSENVLFKDKIEALEMVIDNVREERDVEKISFESLELIMAQYMVKVELEKNQMIMNNEETVQKLQSKNSMMKRKLHDKKEKTEMLEKNIAKIKNDCEKQIGKWHDISNELKYEKEQQEKLKEYVQFNQVEQHELEKSLRDTIDALNEKIRMLEEREKWKEKRDTQVEKMKQCKQNDHAQKSRFEEKLKEKRSRMGEDRFNEYMGPRSRP